MEQGVKPPALSFYRSIQRAAVISGLAYAFATALSVAVWALLFVYAPGWAIGLTIVLLVAGLIKPLWWNALSVLAWLPIGFVLSLFNPAQNWFACAIPFGRGIASIDSDEHRVLILTTERGAVIDVWRREKGGFVVAYRVTGHNASSERPTSTYTCVSGGVSGLPYCINEMVLQDERWSALAPGHRAT